MYVYILLPLFTFTYLLLPFFNSLYLSFCSSIHCFYRWLNFMNDQFIPSVFLASLLIYLDILSNSNEFLLSDWFVRKIETFVLRALSDRWARIYIRIYISIYLQLEKNRRNHKCRWTHNWQIGICLCACRYYYPNNPSKLVTLISKQASPSSFLYKNPIY